MKSPDLYSRRAKPSVALAATASLLLAVFLARPSIQSDPAPNARTDEDAIDTVVERSISAAQAGDLEAWLNCFAGDALSQHESSLSVADREQFAAGLRVRTKSLRSYVTTDWQVEGTRAVVELERVFADRNVRAKLDLRNINGHWKITGETFHDEFSPEILYGTPVVPQTSEPD
ncbi:hypothetical protein GC176_04165 [bacterium]|nr:hypothetical protein [bacterium]